MFISVRVCFADSEDLVADADFDEVVRSGGRPVFKDGTRFEDSLRPVDLVIPAMPHMVSRCKDTRAIRWTEVESE